MNRQVLLTQAECLNGFCWSHSAGGFSFVAIGQFFGHFFFSDNFLAVFRAFFCTVHTFCTLMVFLLSLSSLSLRVIECIKLGF